MNRKLMNRRSAGALTAALVLGTAAPAAARFDLNPQAPVVPARSVPHYGKANILPPYTGVKVPVYGKANVLPPFVSQHVKGFPDTTAAPAVAATPRAVVNQPGGGDGSDLIYVLAGGVVFAIGGLGGAFVAGRRRGARTAAGARSTIAA